jgi:hypothetical protein
MKSLAKVAAHRREHFEADTVLDALGRHPNSEAMRESDRGTYDAAFESSDPRPRIRP